MATAAVFASKSTLVLSVGALALLAVVLLVGTLARRQDSVVIGRLSRETQRADRPRRPSDVALRRQPVGREFEGRVRAEQVGRASELESVGDRRPAVYVPPGAEMLGVSRRRFLNRSIVNISGFSLGTFALATVGFLWPTASGGFGSKIRLGSLSAVKSRIAGGNGFLYLAEGRMWVTEYPTSALDEASAVYAPGVLAGMEQGLVALYQKCPHLGCRVPQCETSQWFECPCHGSQYNRVGEKKGGPAPRGMDRFPIEVAGDQVIVDTAVIVQGPPIGTNTTGQEAEGPHCIGGGGE